MEKYTYKESGVEWLGEIPEHWETKRLFNICEFIRGNSGFEKNDLLSEGKYVALQYGKTYKVEEVNEEFQYYVNENFYKSSQIVNYGDVIFVSTSETMEDLGHSVFYNRNNIGLIGGEQILLKPNKNILDGKYLFYASKVFGNGLNKFATGIKVFRFDVYDLKTIYISLPKPKEQKAIAEYLEKSTAKIDRIIAIKQEQLVKMEQMRKSEIHRVTTKGLNNDIEFKDSGIKWLGLVPKHWKVDRIKFYATFRNGYAFKSSEYVQKEDEGVDLIRIGDLKDGNVSLVKNKRIPLEIALKTKDFEIKENDILIALTGATIGKASKFNHKSKALLNQRVGLVRERILLKNNFLNFLTKTDGFIEFINLECYGSAQDNIGINTLKNIYFAFPPLAEQTDIIKYLVSYTSKIDKSKTNIISQIETLEAYRKSLIYECVTGKKQVTSAIKKQAYA